MQEGKRDASGATVHTDVAVSVLIVNYRSYEELEACLASLAPGSASDMEVIVVDHASDPARLGQLQERFAAVRFVASAENPGFAAGVNHGARLARGRYLLLLNPDAAVVDDVARELAAWMDAQADIGVVGARVLDADGSVQASARRFPDLTTAFGGRTSWLTRVLPGNPLSRRNLLAHGAVRVPLPVDWVSGACMMVRRSAFENVGGMDEGFFLYWEDADLCRRLKHAGWQTFYYPHVSVIHLCGRASRHASERSLTAFHRSVYRYYRKHTGPFGRLLLPVVYLGLQVRLALMLASSRRHGRV